MKTHKEEALKIFNSLNKALVNSYCNIEFVRDVCKEYTKDQGFYDEINVTGLVAIDLVIENIKSSPIRLYRPEEEEIDLEFWENVRKEFIKL